MHDWKSGLRKNVWLWIAITIGLMSGITSIVREGIAMFRPSAVPPGRLFFTCLWISFLTAAIYVLVAQQHRIADLENQLHTLNSSKDDLESVRLEVAGLMQVGNALTIDLLQVTGGGSGNCGTLHCRNGLTSLWFCFKNKVTIQMQLRSNERRTRSYLSQVLLTSTGKKNIANEC